MAMFDLISAGGGPDDVRKEARAVVAAYLNALFGIDYPYTPEGVSNMWDDAVSNGTFADLHDTLGAVNQLGYSIGSSASASGAGVGSLMATVMLPGALAIVGAWRRRRDD